MQTMNETETTSTQTIPQSLHIISTKHAFASLPLSSPLTSKDPSHLSPALSSHLSHLRKQKFQYLELNAKDKYIKTIVSDTDDAPLITAGTNAKLASAIEVKKAALRTAKARLIQRQTDMRTLAPLVEQEHDNATALTAQLSARSSSILNARLTLTRLRQAYPTPRLTIPSALAHLDAQSTSLQSLDEQLSSLRRSVALAKERLKEEGRAVEGLRVERAESMRAVREQVEGVQDDSLVPLYDWFTNSLALHRCMHNLLSSEHPTENEWHLTYLIPKGSSKSSSSRITLILLFHPNTRLLASASCSPPLDIGEIVAQCVESNDAPGLVSSVLQLASRIGA